GFGERSYCGSASCRAAAVARRRVVRAPDGWIAGRRPGWLVQRRMVGDRQRASGPSCMERPEPCLHRDPGTLRVYPSLRLADHRRLLAASRGSRNPWYHLCVPAFAADASALGYQRRIAVFLRLLLFDFWLAALTPSPDHGQECFALGVGRGPLAGRNDVGTLSRLRPWPVAPPLAG